MSNEISFETILRSGAELKISDIYEKDDITYFKINGYQFQTYDNKIQHEGSPMYDHPLTKIWAHDHNDPEGIERHDQMMDNVNKELELWYKHRLTVLKVCLCISTQILVAKGDKAFLDYLDKHFMITAEDEARKMIMQLEKS